MNGSLAYSIAESCQLTRTGWTTLYQAIRSGNLRAVKRGGRTLILAEDPRRGLETLPCIVTSPESRERREARQEYGQGPSSKRRACK
jgi:excisionase family DNA binding protein